MSLATFTAVLLYNGSDACTAFAIPLLRTLMAALNDHVLSGPPMDSIQDANPQPSDPGTRKQRDPRLHTLWIEQMEKDCS